MNAFELQLRTAIAGISDGRHRGRTLTTRIICTGCGIHRASDHERCRGCGSEDYAFVKATAGDVRLAEETFKDATRALIYVRAGFVPIVTES